MQCNGLARLPFTMLLITQHADGADFTLRICRSHPHRDAEIFSYIIDGHLSHKDSMGNSEALPRGCVQYLSAGTGIAHSVQYLPWGILPKTFLFSTAVCPSDQSLILICLIIWYCMVSAALHCIALHCLGCIASHHLAAQCLCKTAKYSSC